MLMRIFSYIIDHDVGFAPNPFFRICSLAACKPAIRRTATKGDFLMGTGARLWSGRLIYWAEIERIITFDEYWRDTSFNSKRAVMNGSMMQCYGDNIYHTEGEEVIQEDSFHSREGGEKDPGNFGRDVGKTDRVLLASNYCYLGRKAIKIPEYLDKVVHTTQGHKCNFDVELRDDCLKWFFSFPNRGWVGDPIDWST